MRPRRLFRESPRMDRALPRDFSRRRWNSHCSRSSFPARDRFRGDARRFLPRFLRCLAAGEAFRGDFSDEIGGRDSRGLGNAGSRCDTSYRTELIPLENARTRASYLINHSRRFLSFP